MGDSVDLLRVLLMLGTVLLVVAGGWIALGYGLWWLVRRVTPPLAYVHRVGPTSVYIVDNQPAAADRLRQAVSGAELAVPGIAVHLAPDRIHVVPTARQLLRWLRWQRFVALALDRARRMPRHDERSIILCDLGADPGPPDTSRSNLRALRALRRSLGPHASIIVHTHRVTADWLQAVHAAGANACLAKQLTTRDDLLFTMETLTALRPKPFILLIPSRHTRTYASYAAGMPIDWRTVGT